MKNNNLIQKQFLIYQNNQGDVKVNVLLKDETIWLTQKAMGELFDTSSDNVGLHLKNIYLSNELDKTSTAEKISVVQKEGSRNVKRAIQFYNLDTIIAFGYRVNSQKATQFRIWATKVLKELTP